MRRILFGLATLGACAAANADYTSNFEAPTYSGSTAGVALTNGFGGPAGQDNWYNPVSGSIDGKVYAYTGNTPGTVTNPTGGAQFLGLINGATPSRAQHAIDFSAGGVWTASFDFMADRLTGVLPVINNIGSFSLQPSTTARFYQTLYTWDNLATGNAMDANYIHYDVGGTVQATELPGPAWDALNLNTWYRQSTTWDFGTNRILSVSIDNLHNADPAVTVDVSGLGWYLFGGAAPSQPLPTDFRFFAGGGANNTYITGWDNASFTLVPAPAGSLALVGTGLLAIARRRRA